ncbi:hypothetical protein ACPCUV_36385 [Streptomyces platensis]|uniref:hypothetical protein n=1 Tax=Streptomyces platensis TaxID=58346 RepID=UPI003C2B8646
MPEMWLPTCRMPTPVGWSLVAALAEHRRTMWLREEARLSGGSWREARAAITAPWSALETSTSAVWREEITSPARLRDLG